jgi:hypothetical protein
MRRVPRCAASPRIVNYIEIQVWQSGREGIKGNTKEKSPIFARDWPVIMRTTRFDPSFALRLARVVDLQLQSSAYVDVLTRSNKVAIPKCLLVRIYQCSEQNQRICFGSKVSLILRSFESTTISTLPLKLVEPRRNPVGFEVMNVTKSTTVQFKKGILPLGELILPPENVSLSELL